MQGSGSELELLLTSVQGNLIELIFTKIVIGFIQSFQDVDVVRQLFDALHLLAQELRFQKVLHLSVNKAKKKLKYSLLQLCGAGSSLVAGAICTKFSV